MSPKPKGEEKKERECGVGAKPDNPEAIPEEELSSDSEDNKEDVVAASIAIAAELRIAAGLQLLVLLLRPPPQPSNMAYGGSQIALVPTYNVDIHKDVEMWIATVDRCTIQFDWKSNRQIASVVKNKLVGKAAFLPETERRKNLQYIYWNDQGIDATLVPPVIVAEMGLKTKMIQRFKTRINQLEAVMHLTIRATESIHKFYDRVRWATEIKNHTATEACRKEAGYILGRDCQPRTGTLP
jgi:hypothetical protein